MTHEKKWKKKKWQFVSSFFKSGKGQQNLLLSGLKISVSLHSVVCLDTTIYIEQRQTFMVVPDLRSLSTPCKKEVTIKKGTLLAYKNLFWCKKPGLQWLIVYHLLLSSLSFIKLTERIVLTEPSHNVLFLVRSILIFYFYFLESLGEIVDDERIFLKMPQTPGLLWNRLDPKPFTLTDSIRISSAVSVTLTVHGYKNVRRQ